MLARHPHTPRHMKKTESLASRRTLMMLLLAAAPALVLTVGQLLRERINQPPERRSGTGLARELMDMLTDRIAQPLQMLEWRLQNYVHSEATPAPLNEQVIVLGIDDATLQTKSAWPEDIEGSKPLQLIKLGYPFTREVWAEVVPKLLDAGAKAVFLDLMFTGPSGEHPEGDETFRKVLAKYPGRVLLGANFTETLGLNGMVPILQLPWSGFSEETDPPPANVGYINYWDDPDQVVRWARYRRSMRNEDANRPELGHLDPMDSIITVMLKAMGQGQAAPADDAKYFPRFSDPGAYPPHSLHEIFVPDMWTNNFKNGDMFKDKVILIGDVTPHGQDFHLTPVGRLTGVQVHAQVLAATLNAQFLEYAPRWLEYLGIVGGALLAWALVAFLRRPVTTMFLLIACSFLLVVLCQELFEHWNLVVEGVGPMLAFNLAGLLGLSYDFMLERRQRQQLRGYLQRYFSPDVVDLMLRDPEHFRTLQRGANRVITVLFSDLRGFTSLSEKLTPQQLVHQLNEYFNRMVAVIHGHTGGIDKFIGDAIMAVWGWVGSTNDEESIKQSAIDAVVATLKMREELETLNADWVAKGIGELKIGVGIHQGEAVVGDLGSEKQSGFTVIGDSVNTASRLEGTTKEYGVDNIISDVIWNHVKDRFLCRSADLVRVKGKLVPTPIYTVLKEGIMALPPGLESFEAAVVLYREGKFPEALARLNQAASEGLNDYLTQVYIDRCKDLIETPPENWTGVYVMTKK